MAIQKFTIDPPFAHQAGDLYTRVGNTLRQIRGGVTIDTRTLGAGSVLTQSVHIGGSNVTEFFEEQKMPGQNVACIAVSEQANGTVIFRFSNGNDSEYPSWQSVAEVADEIDASQVIAQKILVGKAYRESPDGSNKTTQVGASVSLNLLADVPIVYTEPE